MKPKHGDYKEADNIRYNRIVIVKKQKEPLERKEWDVKRENLKRKVKSVEEKKK